MANGRDCGIRCHVLLVLLLALITACGCPSKQADPRNIQTANKLVMWAGKIEIALGLGMRLDEYLSSSELLEELKKRGVVKDGEFNEMRLDYWGNPFVFEYNSANGQIEILLVSHGNDQQKQTPELAKIVLKITKSGTGDSKVLITMPSGSGVVTRDLSFKGEQKNQ